MLLQKEWTTIPPSFQKTDDEIRRLCDIHLLYVCRDTYGVLKPVFEWKSEVPIGEVSLVTPSTCEPLGDTTEAQLAKDANDQNIVEVKQETDTQLQTDANSVQDQLGLVNFPALPESDLVFLDTTTNLLVDLPGVEELPLDATRSIPTVDKEGQPMDATIETNVNTGDDELALPSQIKPPPQNLATSVPCSIVLKDVSVELKGKTSVRIPHTKEEMCKVRCV